MTTAQSERQDIYLFIKAMPKQFSANFMVWNGNEYERKHYAFHLDIDPDQIRNMVLKAAKNRSRKSVDGAVEVNVEVVR